MPDVDYQAVLDSMDRQDPSLRVLAAMNRPHPDEEVSQIEQQARSEGVRPELIRQRMQHMRFLQESANAGLSHEQTQQIGQHHLGINVDQRTYRVAQQERALNQNRQALAGAQEGTLSFISRNMLPFGSSVRGFLDRRSYSQAQNRYREGTASDNDVAVIAQFERLQNIQQNETLGQSMVRGLASVPAAVGEAIIGGWALRAVGLGAQAVTAGRMGAAAAPSMGARAGTFAAGLASMPSMYLTQAAQLNLDNGRDAGDWRGFPSAVTMGAMQYAVLGSLGRFGNSITGQGVLPVAQRLLTRTATGLAEQHLFVEPLAAAVSSVLPEAYRLDTGHGLLSNAFQGKWGEAWKQLAVSAVTFAAFSGLHEGQHGAPPPREVLGGTIALSRHMAEAGIPREQIPHRIAEITTWIDQGHARQAVMDLPAGPLRDYALTRVAAVDAQRAFQAEQARTENAPRPAAANEQAVPAMARRAEVAQEGQLAAPPGQPQQPTAPAVPQATAQPSAPARPRQPGQPPDGLTVRAREAWKQRYEELSFLKDPADRMASADEHAAQVGRTPSPANAWEPTGTKFGENGTFTDKNGKTYRIEEVSKPVTKLATIPQGHEHIELVAHEVGGGRVGSYDIHKNNGHVSGHIMLDNKSSQGRGIAEALYDYAQSKHGVPVPSEAILKGGEKLWARNAEWKQFKAASPDASYADFIAKRSGTRTPQQTTPQITNETPLTVRNEMRARALEHAKTEQARTTVEGARRGEGQRQTDMIEASKTFGHTDREAQVFWAMQGPEAASLADVARTMGITRERVRQIAKEANAKYGQFHSDAVRRAGERADAEMPTKATTEAEGMHQEGNMIQEHEARLEALHDNIIEMLERARETGEPIDMDTVEHMYRTEQQEIENARLEIPDHARDTPSVRGEFEQSVQSGFQAGATPVEGEASPGVRGGEEAARTTAERGPGAPTDVVADAPATAERGQPGGDVLRPAQEGITSPNPLTNPIEFAKWMAKNEEGTFVPQQFADNAKQLWQGFHDRWLKRIGPALRATADAIATNLYKPGTGKDLGTVLQGLTGAEKPFATEFRDKGIWGLFNGKKTTVGKAFEDVVKPLQRADIIPMDAVVKPLAGHWFEKDSKPSNFDAFATARSFVDEHNRGSPLVSQTRFQEAQGVLQHFQQTDPAFVQRATAVHDSIIKDIYNASLIARASPGVHNITLQDAQHYIQEHQMYIDARRGAEADEFKTQGGPGRNREHMGGAIKSRQGESDRPVFPPLETAQQRLVDTARVVTEQLRRNAYEEVLATPGMDKWSELMPLGYQPDPREAAWFWRDSAGQERVRIIKDKPLYDLMTNIQGYDSPFTQLFHAASTIPGMHTITQGVKTGATTMSLGFQLFRNSVKDAYTFLSNTRDQVSLKDLPMAYAKMYAAEWNMLTKGASKNEIFNTLKELRGEEMRQFTFTQTSDRWGPVKSAIDFGKQLLRIAGAGELAPRALEMETRLRELGWSPERLAKEREAARQTQARGGQYTEPLPFYEGLEAAKAAREVTVDFSQAGYMGAELNKIVPFFNPAVQGVWKQLNNWRSNTKGAAIALAAFLAARVAHWALFKDEEWYKQQNAYDRFNNFLVPFQGKVYRLPGPRDMEIPIGGATISLLDHMAGLRPDWAGLVKESAGAMTPPLVPTAVGLPWQIGTNKNWMGSPIVPRRDENLPAMHNAINHQAPYAIQQLTGGRGELSMRGLTGLNLEARSMTRNLNEYYDELHSLEGERALAKRQGRMFQQEGRYQQLHAIQTTLNRLNAQYRTASEDRQREIRRQQNRLAGTVIR